MRKLFAIGSKVGLSARTPPTIAMLGDPNIPTQLSSGALTMDEPRMFLLVVLVFHVPAPQADQTWPGIIVTEPMTASVKGPLVLRLRSKVTWSRTFMWVTLDSGIPRKAPVAL